MRIIDAHVHLYPPEVEQDPAAWAATQGERHWALLCTRKRRSGRAVQSLPTLTQLIGTLDAAGIERAVLLGWYWEKWDTCRWQNRFHAECVRAHPDRLSAFAAVHPGGGADAIRDELHWARDHGLIGVGELSPHSQGHGLDDPDFQRALELAGELRLPVNLHVSDPESPPFPGKIETPAEDFLLLARRHPRTTFILAHWGGMLPLRDTRFAELDNLYYDTAASPLMYDTDAWPRALAALGEDRVLFGSDFPLNLYPKLDEVPGLVRFVGEALTCGATQEVLGGNAARLLRI